MSKKQEKLTTANLYSEMDRLADIDKEKEIKKTKLNYSKRNAIFKLTEILKCFVILLLISSPFLINHFYSHEISSYFSKAESSIIAPINKHYEETTTNTSSSKNVDLASIPEIYPTGTISKDGKQYVVFKYQNKIYTKTKGEKFSDDTLEIKEIKNNEVEIKDFRGNIYNFSITKK